MVDVAAFIMFVNEPIPACPMAATVSGCFSRAPLRTERVPGQSRSSSSRNIMNSLRALANPRLRAAERSYFFSCLKQRMRVSLEATEKAPCVIGRGIIHNNQLPAGVCLGLHAVDGLGEHCTAIARGITTLISGCFFPSLLMVKMPRFKPLYAKRDHTLQVCLHCLFHGKKRLTY